METRSLHAQKFNCSCGDPTLKTLRLFDRLTDRQKSIAAEMVSQFVDLCEKRESCQSAHSSQALFLPRLKLAEQP